MHACFNTLFMDANYGYSYHEMQHPLLGMRLIRMMKLDNSDAKTGERVGECFFLYFWVDCNTLQIVFHHEGHSI